MLPARAQAVSSELPLPFIASSLSEVTAREAADAMIAFLDLKLHHVVVNDHLDDTFAIKVYRLLCQTPADQPTPPTPAIKSQSALQLTIHEQDESLLGNNLPLRLPITPKPGLDTLPPISAAPSEHGPASSSVVYPMPGSFIDKPITLGNTTDIGRWPWSPTRPLSPKSAAPEVDLQAELAALSSQWKPTLALSGTFPVLPSETEGLPSEESYDLFKSLDPSTGLMGAGRHHRGERVESSLLESTFELDDILSGSSTNDIVPATPSERVSSKEISLLRVMGLANEESKGPVDTLEQEESESEADSGNGDPGQEIQERHRDTVPAASAMPSSRPKPKFQQRRASPRDGQQVMMVSLVVNRPDQSGSAKRKLDDDARKEVGLASKRGRRESSTVRAARDTVTALSSGMARRSGQTNDPPTNNTNNKCK
ncbi:hypothetical protein FRB90_005668 [Tulasnella sp. 427]|nr:hypothetical protein FRB90_005668 [Tulasnella sp. 427]